MKISIVTAVYNAEPYLDKTLSSVLSQNYNNLEYLVLDGASEDGSIETIERYSHQLSYFQSAPDAGQYPAIQAGLERSSGDILGWLNADDIHMPWTLSVVSEIFSQFPEVDWITGLPAFLNPQGQLSSIDANPAAYPQDFIRNGWYRENLAGYLQQESMFWRRSLWDKVGGLDTSLDLAADFKLWTQFAEHAKLVQVATPLAAFRRHPGEQRSTVHADAYSREVKQICSQLPRPPALWTWLASRNKVTKSLSRMLQYKSADTITWSSQTQQWQKVRSRRSLTRNCLGQMTLEYQLRKSAR